jgi:hypothetical protein
MVKTQAGCNRLIPVKKQAAINASSHMKNS